MTLQPIPAKAFALIPRLASDADGEVVNTARAIERQLKAAGLDWHDLVAKLKSEAEPRRRPAPPDTPESWGDLAKWCRDNGAGRLSANETKFVNDMCRRLILGGAPTEKQAKWLRAIYAKLKGA